MADSTTDLDQTGLQKNKLPKRPVVNTAQESFLVKIYSPYKVYYDGEAYSLTADNQTGPFDILARHKNFISLLNPGEIKLSTRQGDQTFKINRAILHHRDNKTSVFLDV